MKSNRPWLLVHNPNYFKGVIGSMVKFDPNARHDPSVIVRFGLMGDGIRPNYQFEAGDGRVAAYSSNSHDKDMQAPNGRYADAELSVDRFTLTALRQLLQRCLDIESGKIIPGANGEGP